MKTYAVHTVYSGAGENELWVTLRFKSEDDDDDVVHIVCALEVDEQDRRHGMDQIFLERDDQARGGYGGADEIVASGQSVRIMLNDAGREQLEFDEPLELVWPNRVRGKLAALKRLSEMKQYVCGRVVHVV